MANGSFLTSQLPVTSNVVTTDRILVLWNAIANVSVGSGSPQTMTITMADFVNSSLSTIKTSIFTSGSLSLGNSTFNTAINSTSLYIQSNIATIFAVNTSGVIIGNGAGLTSLPSVGSNSQLLYNSSGSIGADANLSWNRASSILTIGNSTVNTTVNSSVFVNGNTSINSTVISVGNAGSVLVGNATHNTVITLQGVTVSNNGSNVWDVGGTGAATLLTSLTTGNSTTNSVIKPLTISIQANSTSNTLISNNSISFFTNSSVFSQLNASAFSFGGTSYYIAAPAASLLTANFAMTSTASAQNTFPSGQRTVALAASTTYLFEGQYAWTYANATNVNVAISFGNSAAIGVIGYRFAFASNGTANSTYSGQLIGYAGSNAAVTVNTSTLATTNDASVFFKGYLTTSDAVNITPQFQTAAATGNAPSMLTGTFIKFVPVGNSTINSIGTWT